MFVTIIPYKMVFGGKVLAKIDNKTVFVEGSLPNETIEIEITKDKKDYSEAVATKILNSSEHRVEPFCNNYEQCGGCNLQIADYDYQLQLKREILQDLFTRNKVTLPEITVVSDNSVEYRSRFQFSRGGLKSKNSNAIVPLTDCPCAVPEMRSVLQNSSKLLKAHDRLHVFAHKNVCNPEKFVFGLDDGNSELSLKLLDKIITFDARGFFQSNIAMLEKTIPLIVDGLQGKHLLDMYSGVGTLSVFAAHKFEHVTLVEHNKKALQFANINFSTAGFTNFSTFPMSGELWAKKAKKHTYDTLIIDPPRSGIEKPLLQWLCTEKIPTVRYLSCDPATLARDTKLLLEAGYSIEEFYLLDYYPHTHHMECLVWFTC